MEAGAFKRVTLERWNGTEVACARMHPQFWRNLESDIDAQNLPHLDPNAMHSLEDPEVKRGLSLMYKFRDEIFLLAKITRQRGG